MPDGPRPKGPNYEDDFYAWTQFQAQVVRTLPTADNRFDREHLAEEIEDLGNSYRDAVRSQVRRILLHFLKLAHSPARTTPIDRGQAISRCPKSSGTSALRRCSSRRSASVTTVSFSTALTPR